MEEGNGKGYNPVTIANYFIGLRSSDKELTLMKLLKLSYIAHGVTLAVLSRPDQNYLLANEYVEAWKYGPVFPSIYHEFKDQPGRIQKKAQRFNPQINTVEDWTADFLENEKKVMEWVNKRYGHLEGWELSVITHKKGTPWIEAWEEGKHIRGYSISNDKIKSYYKDILNNPEKEENINE